MSEETAKNYDRLKEIYETLIGEPTPDEEEEAQKELITILESLSAADKENNESIETVLNIVKNWDTLEQWFSEVEGLSDAMKECIDNHFNSKRSPLRNRIMQPRQIHLQ